MTPERIAELRKEHEYAKKLGGRVTMDPDEALELLSLHVYVVHGGEYYRPGHILGGARTRDEAIETIKQRPGDWKSVSFDGEEAWDDGCEMYQIEEIQL